MEAKCGESSFSGTFSGDGELEEIEQQERDSTEQGEKTNFLILRRPVMATATLQRVLCGKGAGV